MGCRSCWQSCRMPWAPSSLSLRSRQVRRGPCSSRVARAGHSRRPTAGSCPACGAEGNREGALWPRLGELPQVGRAQQWLRSSQQQGLVRREYRSPTGSLGKDPQSRPRVPRGIRGPGELLSPLPGAAATQPHTALRFGCPHPAAPLWAPCRACVSQRSRSGPVPGAAVPGSAEGRGRAAPPCRRRRAARDRGTFCW